MVKIIFVLFFSITQVYAFDFSFSALKQKISEIQNKIIESGKVFKEQVIKIQQISSQVLIPLEQTFKISDAVDCPETAPSSIVPNFSKANECDDLNVGQFKINSSSLNSRNKYLMYKPETNKVEVFLNLNFSSDEERTTNPAAMRARVSSCLSSLKGYLKSPDGEEMNIRLVDQAKKDHFLVPETTIKIVGANARSNSASYEEDIDCPTITHEVMHLFGLCDEYEETEPPLKEMYNCRNVVPVTTIMNSHNSAFDESVAQSIDCKCESEKCKNLINEYGSDLTKYTTRSLAHTIPLADVKRYNCDFSSSNVYITKSEANGLEPISIKREDDKIVFIQLDLWEETNGSFSPVKRTIKCDCSPEDSLCNDKLMGYFKRYEKPYYVGNCNLFDGEASRKYVEPKSEENDTLTIKDQVISIYKNPINKKGLLYSNQYKKIYYGNCSQKLPSYNECAENAYKSRNAELSSSATDVCTQRNPQCSDPTFFIGER